MRRFLASVMLAIVIGLGLGATTAHAEGNTITIEQKGYTYSCTTEVQAKETMQIKVDGVQYTCYSPEKEASDNGNRTLVLVLLGVALILVAVLLFSWLFI